MDTEASFPLSHKVQHLLQASMKQSYFNHELAQGLRVMPQELTLLCSLLTAGIPFSDPAHNAQPLLSKTVVEDNEEAYLGTLEWMALRKGWTCHECLHVLAPLLTGEAQSTPCGRDC